MFILATGGVLYGWAVIAALRKGVLGDAALWLISGLFLGLFVTLDHNHVSRWLLGAIALASLVLGLISGWRTELRRWRGQ